MQKMLRSFGWVVDFTGDPMGNLLWPTNTAETTN